jgi:hypothetical protein
MFIEMLCEPEDQLLVRKACLCSLYLTAKFLPICPTWAFLQLGHVNLYTPDEENLSGCWIICIR